MKVAPIVDAGAGAMAKTRVFGVDSDQPEAWLTPFKITSQMLVTQPTGSRKPPR